jgi:hypothetical protein
LPAEPGTNLEESDEPATDFSDVQEPFLLEDTGTVEIEAQIPSEDLQEDSISHQPAEPEVILPQSNWPSPTLYPLRTPKKRRSLAAIDLPSFPRYNPT